MSTIFVPQLDLQQHQEEQDSYNEQRFIDLIHSLTERSILYYCPYDDLTLKNFYQQILIRQQSSVISMEVMHQFISQLKQRNRNELSKQNQYYQQIMRQYLQKGINTMSKRQFKKVMDKYQGDVAIITEILMENSKEAQFIGCELVLELLKQVSTEIQDGIIPELTITQLKTLRLDRNQSNPNSQSIILPIFQDIGQYQIKKILQQCFKQIHKKLSLYRQFISDQEIVQDSQDFQSQLLQIKQSLSQEIEQMIKTNNELNNHCEEFNQIYDNFKEEQILQGEIAQKLKQEVEELKKEVINVYERNRYLQDLGNQLELAAKQAEEQMIKISQHSEQVQQQLREYENNYKQIYKEYEKLVQASTKKSMLLREQQTKKIFATRSIKQQLDDTAHKLNKILAQREKQRKFFKENQESKTNHIFMLQAKLQELEKELKQKNQYLSDYVRDSKLFNSKSGFRISAIVPKDARKSNNPQLPQEKLGRQSVESNYSRISSKTSNFPKANLAVLQPIQQDFNELDEISQVYEQQNILKVIKEDTQQIGSKAFKKNKNAQSKHQPQKQHQKFNCFFSKATIINIYGKKFQTMILLTNRRFCYFDTKARLQKYIPLEKIKEFIFNIDNTNAFVIKPAKDTPKEYIVNDMIFSTRNMAKFQKCIQILRKDGHFKGNVSVKKAENTWIKVASNEYNLKISIPYNHNPFRISLSPHNVFYGQVKEQGIFTSKVDAVIIIQPVGILCFQGEQTYELQVNRTFICFLPIVQDMKIMDKKNSKQAPDKKLIIEYTAKGCEFSYSIIFFSKQDTRKFKKIMQNEMKQLQEMKMQTKDRIMKMFPN